MRPSRDSFIGRNRQQNRMDGAVSGAWGSLFSLGLVLSLRNQPRAAIFVQTLDLKPYFRQDPCFSGCWRKKVGITHDIFVQRSYLSILDERKPSKATSGRKKWVFFNAFFGRGRILEVLDERNGLNGQSGRKSERIVQRKQGQVRCAEERRSN